MVYVGPSTGCYLCRKRKIKCSEEKPGCRNCAVYGQPCPGYRSLDGTRNEASQKARKGSKKDQCPSITEDDPIHRPPRLGSRIPNRQISSTESSRSPENATEPLALYRVSDATWDDRAVCYFFGQYTTTGESTDCVSHLESLPELYVSCLNNANSDGPSSCFRWSVQATALISLGHGRQVPELTFKARKSYGMALRELRQLLSSPDEALKDEIFAAVVLLSLFEDISGERKGLSSSHTTGLELLMKLRGVGQLSNKRGRDLFAYAYAHTHIQILALGDKPHVSTNWIIKALGCGCNPVSRMMLTSSKMSQLFLEVSSALTPNKGIQVPIEFMKVQLVSWIESSTALDQELAEWRRQLPDIWHPLEVYDQNGQPRITLRDISFAAIWNYYRAVRIVVQRMISELQQALAILEPGSNAARLEAASAHKIIQEMISEICLSLPFALGDIDTFGRRVPSSPAYMDEAKPRLRAIHGYSLLWPLWYVLSCGQASPSQARLVRSALARLGSVLGIKLASVLADGRMSVSAAFSPPFMQTGDTGVWSEDDESKSHI